MFYRGDEVMGGGWIESGARPVPGAESFVRPGKTMTISDRPTVAFATLGCKTNQFESAAMRESLEQAGYRVVPFAAGADWWWSTPAR